MGKRDMTEAHWQHFMDLVTSIEGAASLTIDRGNLDQTLRGVTGRKFPKGNTAIATALFDRDPLHARGAPRGVQLVGAAVGAPQNRSGINRLNSFAIKIADMRALTRPREGSIVFLMAYDVFSSGRRLLQIMDGLRLDSSHRLSRYQDIRSLERELTTISGVAPEFVPIVIALVEAFDDGGNEKTAEAKAGALEELRRMFS